MRVRAARIRRRLTPYPCRVGTSQTAPALLAIRCRSMALRVAVQFVRADGLNRLVWSACRATALGRVRVAASATGTVERVQVAICVECGMIVPDHGRVLLRVL